MHDFGNHILPRKFLPYPSTEWKKSVDKENIRPVQLTLCILMDCPIHIDTISMELPIVYFKGSQVDLIFANSADPDELQHYARQSSIDQNGSASANSVVFRGIDVLL